MDFTYGIITSRRRTIILLRQRGINMSEKIKTWLYIIFGIILIGIVASLAFKLLLFLLPIIIVLYIFFNIRNYFRKDNSSSTNSYTREYKRQENNIVSSVDDTVGEVIDVDYEDVNN